MATHGCHDIQAVLAIGDRRALAAHFLGSGRPTYQLLAMLDGCSRMQVGCRLYRRECVM